MAPLLRAEQKGDFIYKMEDNTVTITGCTGEGGAVAIPDRIAGLPVKAVRLFIDGGFRTSSPVTHLTIPASAGDIQIDSFFSNLLAIHVDSANPHYASSDGVLIDKRTSTIIRCPAGKDGNYVIPPGVTTIGSRAFGNCLNLTGITIPSGVTTLASEAFLDCKSLTRITIPEGVASIAMYAFSGCSKLASITIPASVTKLEDSVFPGCTELSAITVDAANPSYRSADGVLFDKKGTKLIQYPAGKKGDYLIPPPIIEIGKSAFYGCAGLTAVTLPADITVIGNGAFSRCTGLTAVTIPASVSTLGDSAFSGCTALASVIFEGNAPSIADRNIRLRPGRGGSRLSPEDEARLLAARVMIFQNTGPDFTIRRYKGSTGFDAPEWGKYTIVEVDPTTETFTWISSDGRTLKAKFINLDGESVIVEKEDGTQVSIPFARLSPASIEQAKRLDAAQN